MPIAAIDSIVPIVPNANDKKQIQNSDQQTTENRINIKNSSLCPADIRHGVERIDSYMGEYEEDVNSSE